MGKTKTPTGCTARSATRGICGAKPVFFFESRFFAPGEIFAECADHYGGPIPGRGRGSGLKIGDRVPVTRHGKTYDGTVSKIGKRGAVYADVTYNNGAYTVRVENRGTA